MATFEDIIGAEDIIGMDYTDPDSAMNAMFAGNRNSMFQGNSMFGADSLAQAAAQQAMAQAALAQSAAQPMSTLQSVQQQAMATATLANTAAAQAAAAQPAVATPAAALAATGQPPATQAAALQVMARRGQAHPSAAHPAVAQAAVQQANKNKFLRQLAMKNASAVMPRPLTKSRDYPLGFPTTSLAAGTTSIIVVQPQVPFRGRRLVIPSDIGGALLLNDLKVGKNSMFAASGPVPARTFSEYGVGVDLNLDTAQISQQISLNITNTSGATVTFNAALIGTAVE